MPIKMPRNAAVLREQKRWKKAAREMHADNARAAGKLHPGAERVRPKHEVRGAVEDVSRSHADEITRATFEIYLRFDSKKARKHLLGKLREGVTQTTGGLGQGHSFDMRLGSIVKNDAVHAIEYALTLETRGDTGQPYYFLKDWSEGDLKDWPEYKKFLKEKGYLFA